MKKLLISLFIGGGLTVGAVYAIGNIPLTTAWSAAEQYLPMPTRWSEADFEGTLSSGRVRQLEVPQIGGMELGKLDLDWEVRGGSLATGRLSVALDGNLEEASFQGVATRSVGGWQVTEGSGEVAAEQLQKMAQRRGVEVPPIAGKVTYKIDRLELDNNGEIKALEGRVVGNGLSLNQNGQRLDLGTLASTVTGSNGAASGQLSDQGGPLGLSGSWRATQNGQYELDAVVTPKTSTTPALREWLSEHGEPTGDGFRIHHAGATPTQP